MKSLRVLVACEESQAITKEFRKLGHEAFSCDILPCSGGHPEWHYQRDVFEVIDEGWDLMIAHPPCTYLTVTGNRWFKNKDGSRNEDRYLQRDKAIKFVYDLLNCNIPHISLENPVGYISTFIRKPDQIIQPYMFGDEASKKTCLWTKNLPNLTPTNIVGRGERVFYKSGKSHPKWYAEALSKSKTPEERRTLRSKTFPGIAKAIAVQYSQYIIDITDEETSTE